LKGVAIVVDCEGTADVYLPGLTHSSMLVQAYYRTLAGVS